MRRCAARSQTRHALTGAAEQHEAVAIGAALSDCGRVDTKSPFELHHQAASRAVADAGLTKDDVDGFGSAGTGSLAPIEIAEYLGLRPTWADGTSVGGSTWEFMAEHAVEAIQAGHAEVVVLAYGSTTRADLKARAPRRQPVVRRARSCTVRRPVSATPSSRSTRW